MNSSKRTNLIRKINDIEVAGNSDGIPVVSLDDFFDGNDDMGSIGCNLIEHPGVEHFYHVLREIQEDARASIVLVGILDVEESDETMWPFSDSVYIVTAADESEVEAWVTSLQPDEVYECGGDELNPSLVPNPGERVVRIWWD